MPQKRQQRNKELLDIEKILKILPHRYPFLLVDRVLELEKGKSIVAIKNVTYNEHFFQGHFPQKKVMPGVLIFEAVAQAGGILLYHSIPDPQKIFVFLSTINNAKFRRPVVPGDQLRLEVEIIRLRSRFCHIRGKAYVGEEIAAESDAMASLVRLEELNERE
jgi:3-hydroxyacyl-[acyl-carrier-protein] dehydratase/UDP-3-O-[3-hydroxymyristoyl] N-acetylglucosamine deacetylase/3-hydroxyacyl-[acyl-carrier-protein] dehydratase